MERNCYRMIIDYKFKGIDREAIVTIVDRPPMPTFYFNFKKRPPEMFTKVKGVWLKGNTRPLTDDIERVDLWRTLTAAIDKQLSTLFKLN